MYQNYLKIALRNFWKQGLFSIVNVLGLAIGLVAGIFILLYVQDEKSYDHFHQKRERIYRITETFKNGEEYTITAMTPDKIAPLLTAASPAVETFTCLETDAGSREIQIIEYGDKKVESKAITFADSNFFGVFSFPLLKGNPQKVLKDPNTLVLSQSQAKGIFGTKDPIGEVLKIKDSYSERTYQAMVTGVMADMPHNSHFHYDFLVSKVTGNALMPYRLGNWGWTSQYSYIVLRAGHSIAEVERAMKQVKEKNAPDWFVEQCNFGIQPLTDIHLRSNVKDEIEANGSAANVSIFSLVGLFILLIACINYMNLATARAATRAREVGMRKVIGAHYLQLVRQFLGESILVAGFSLVLALILALLLLPGFNQLTGKTMHIQDIINPRSLLIWSSLVMVLGVLAGSFPAFFLASFQPIKVLKGLFSKSGQQTLLLRKALVVLQFSISIALIVGMLVVYQQWDFLRNKRLGITTDQMVMLPIRSQKMVKQYPTFKKEILRHSNVLAVTASSKTPLSAFVSYNVFDIKSDADDYTMPGVGIDEDFAKVYGLELAAGRNFYNFSADSNSVLLNEAAVKLIGVKEPLGLALKFGGSFQPKVVGVFKDFNFESLHQNIQPMFFYHTTGDYNTITVRIGPANVQETLAQLEKSWNAMGLSQSFSFTFLDDDINLHYEAERRFFQVFTVLSALAIFIACLGLFGLAAFTAEQRTKEIGIRKVLGASVAGITRLLAQDFLKLILIATLLASPIAYYFMQKWLADFAYHINIEWWMFVLAAALAIGIALLTIGFQSIKAALANPMKSLHSE